MEPKAPNETARSELVEELRQLRTDARRLNSSLVKRLKPFQKADGSFKTLPDSKDRSRTRGPRDISVASTCTVLMAAMGASTSAVGSDKKENLFDKSTLREVFKSTVIRAEWGSSGLPDGNAFTTAMVVRTAGFVVQAGIMAANKVASLKHRKFRGNEDVALKTLRNIVRLKARRPEKVFAVMKYPPKTTHAYWFVDGAIGMKVDLPKSTWEKIGEWASNEFHRQLIYVSAGNDALMDPPSLAMAACLINRIRRLGIDKQELAEVTRKLPSNVELEFGIKQVFSKQSDSGIWHRYFPLFHFPTGQGAADYCFSFEFLEATLVEFGKSILRDFELLQQIKRVIQWCDTHEVAFTDQRKKTYRGWNSGGEVRKLAAGQAESWATASVHMFLTQLEIRVNDVLDEIVLKQFGFDRTAVVESSKKFKNLLDAALRFPNETTTLKTVVQSEILDPVKTLDLDREKLIRDGIPVPRSALLFGPPGTSKSRLAKAIAEYLGWPLVTITPSEFLGNGLEQVHAQVDDRFRDLMDLRRVVVFFDEMDALAQTREGESTHDAQGSEGGATRQSNAQADSELGSLDVTRQLLTTSMLPKLANLWAQKRVIFLMATNHKQHLDPAITRPNRFDLLLCVEPPPWRIKRAAKNLEAILLIPQANLVEKELLRLAPNDSKTAKRLDVFTVSEIGIFLDHLRRQKRKTKVVDAMKLIKNPSDFQKIVDSWAATSITLRTEKRPLEEFEQDRNESRRQYYPGEE